MKLSKLVKLYYINNSKSHKSYYYARILGTTHFTEAPNYGSIQFMARDLISILHKEILNNTLVIGDEDSSDNYFKSILGSEETIINQSVEKIELFRSFDRWYRNGYIFNKSSWRINTLYKLYSKLY